MAKVEQLPIDSDTLDLIVQRGDWSPTLVARMEFSSAAQILQQHVAALVRCSECGLTPWEAEAPKYRHIRCTPCTPVTRVWPNMSNPQTSGRMSVSGPPLGNFTADQRYGPHGIRDAVCPDSGHVWICMDWSAVEARKIAHYDRDPVDNEAFARGYDIHTVTAREMFGWPAFTFEPTKAGLKSPAGLEWCAEIGWLIHRGQCRLTQHVGCDMIPWSGTHRYRTIVKATRYTLQYAVNEKALARYVIEMRMPREELFTFGVMYLRSKPWLVAWKNQTWASVSRSLIARTWAGRARKFPQWRSVAAKIKTEKEGLNHIIQGGVADMMKMTLAAVWRMFREQGVPGRLVYQSHDGAKWQVPVGNVGVLSRIQEIVEREWVIDGRAIRYPGEFEIVYAPGEGE